MAVPSVLILAVGLLVVVIGLVTAGIAVARSPQNMGHSNPNLHPCRDCGQYISIRAATCPRCGGPNKGA